MLGKVDLIAIAGFYIGANPLDSLAISPLRQGGSKALY